MEAKIRGAAKVRRGSRCGLSRALSAPLRLMRISIRSELPAGSARPPASARGASFLRFAGNLRLATVQYWLFTLLTVLCQLLLLAGSSDAYSTNSGRPSVGQHSGRRRAPPPEIKLAQSRCPTRIRPSASSSSCGTATAPPTTVRPARTDRAGAPPTEPAPSPQRIRLRTPAPTPS